METRKAVLLLVVIFGVFGAADGLARGNSAAQFFLQALSIVAVAGVVFFWATFDARANGRELSTFQIICIVLFGYLAVPFYLAANRPLGARARPILKGILVFFSCVIAFGSTYWLTSGVAP